MDHQQIGPTQAYVYSRLLMFVHVCVRQMNGKWTHHITSISSRKKGDDLSDWSAGRSKHLRVWVLGFLMFMHVRIRPQERVWTLPRDQKQEKMRMLATLLLVQERKYCKIFMLGFVDVAIGKRTNTNTSSMTSINRPGWMPAIVLTWARITKRCYLTEIIIRTIEMLTNSLMSQFSHACSRWLFHVRAHLFT